MDAIYRNDRTSAAAHGGREPGHSEPTDDTDYAMFLAARRLTRSAIAAVLIVSILRGLSQDQLF
jgi:hypothetical protein